MANHQHGLFLSDEEPMLETLDYTIRIGSTPTFLYFDLYLYSAYTAHNVYINAWSVENKVSMQWYVKTRKFERLQKNLAKKLLANPKITSLDNRKRRK